MANGIKNIFSLKMIVDYILTAVGVGLVAWVLGLIIALTSAMGAWSAVITSIVALVLLGTAVKMHTGKEGFVDLLSIGLVVAIVFGILAIFGLNLLAPVFEFGTLLGWVMVVIALLFGRVVAGRISGMMNL